MIMAILSFVTKINVIKGDQGQHRVSYQVTYGRFLVPTTTWALQISVHVFPQRPWHYQCIYI